MRALAAALLAAALLAGCGDDIDPVASEEPRTVTVESAPAQTTEQVASAAPVAEDFDPRAIYEEVAPGVVTVLSLTGDGGASGSGFVLNEDGEIATNAHVVTSGTGSSIEEARQVYVRFPDRNQVEAEIVGFDADEDVALLKLDPEGLDLRPLELGTVDNLQVGAPVAAIGSPFGEEGSLSVGIISALDRTLESLTDFSIAGAIQTDAAINSGNSGGPLVDADGRVLGVNAQINSNSGDNSGVGFAIPIDSVERSLDELRDDGKVDYAYLGVSSSPLYPQLADRLGLDVEHGSVIAEVVPGGPADEAGLKPGEDEIRFQGIDVPVDGDVITKVDDTEVRLDGDLGRILEDYRPGDVVELEVHRGDDVRTVKVELGRRPD